MIYQLGKKQCSNSGRKRMIFTPGKWFYCPSPLPSGISWVSDPPTPLEFLDIFWNHTMLVFAKREKPEYPEKNLSEQFKGENQKQT